MMLLIKLLITAIFVLQLIRAIKGSYVEKDDESHRLSLGLTIATLIAWAATMGLLNILTGSGDTI